MKKTIVLLFALLPLALLAQADEDSPRTYAPMVSKGHYLGEIPPLRDLVAVENAPKPPKSWHKRNYFFSNPYLNPKPQPQGGDPLAHALSGAESNMPQIVPGLNLEGLREPNVTPPDPSGDVGKDHYVQMVNQSNGALFEVRSKQTGAIVLGPIETATIWSQVGSGSIGDPIIQYDHAAQRWLMMEMQGFAGGLLVAVSQTSDPTGAWKAYQYQTLGFPDYPKLYVWHNAYILTVNEIVNGNTCAGYAFEREAILNGESSFDVYRFVMPNFGGILYQPATGADWESGPAPPQNSPAYIFRVYDDGWNGGKDRLQVWEVRTNWQDPASSSLTGPFLLTPTPFETKVCFGNGLFDCIEQPDQGAPRITALENIIMYRAPYRNFGTYESVVLNHVADVSGEVGDGGDAAIRWYELQKSSSGTWQIHQEGTYAPDFKTNRFTGTISQDGEGNIALGYSVCSDVTQPGLRVTGRRASDPPGQMTVQEYSIVEGGTSHLDARWGDYSSMAVDPVDDRTFWFTGEYQPVGANWGTKIASFRIQRDTYDISPVTLVEPQSAPDLGPGEAVRVSVFNGGLQPASNFAVKLWFEGSLVATEQVAANLAPGNTYVHSFASTVDMPTVGKSYSFQVVVNWGSDAYSGNDTLRVQVVKQTTNDAGIPERLDFPNLVCGTSKAFRLVLENSSGAALSSAQLLYRANGSQPFKTYDWTGNLPPEGRDTISLTVDGIKNGVNFLQCIAQLPNGLEDEAKANDTLTVKYFGNITGNYLLGTVSTDFGELRWELLSQANTLLSFGTLNSQNDKVEICAVDNTCYKLRVRSTTFEWKGAFVLLDIFGDTLLTFNEASVSPEVYPFCTPSRKAVDLGAYALVSPKTGANLSNNESVSVQVRNFGTAKQGNVNVSFRLDGGTWVNATLPDSLAPAADVVFTFPNGVDLSAVGPYLFEASTTVAGDENTGNDAITRTIKNKYNYDVNLAGVNNAGGCIVPESALLLVKLENVGFETIESVQIESFINGEGPFLDTLAIEIPSEETRETAFQPGIPLVPGSNTVSLRLVGVDEQIGDENISNNFIERTFELYNGGVEVLLGFATDEHPAETRWQLLREDGSLVQESGPYTEALMFYFYNFCLKKDTCYVLRILDSGNNGLNTYISMSEATGGTIYAGVPGDFGGQFDIPFCAGTTCAGLQLAVSTTPSSDNGAADGKIVAVLSGGIEPYVYSIDPPGTFQGTGLFDNLLPGIYTVRGYDALNCIAESQVSIGTMTTKGPGTASYFKIAPNPTKGLAWITFQDAAEQRPYIFADLYDTQGRRLQVIRLARWDEEYRGGVSVETYASGVYYLHLRGNKKQNVLKLVRQ
jgi:hypothetical protein